jgi:formyl-CoA transferase
VVFGVCYQMADVPNDEQAKISGALVPMEDGKMLTVSSPFWIEGEDKTRPRRAPTIGQHNDEVLAAAGFSTNEIQKLRGDGIVK